MKPVMLGIAGASAAKAGSLLDRSARVALEPFADVLHAVANSFSPHEAENSIEPAPSAIPLANRVQGALSSAGIQIEEPLELTVEDGKLVVVGNHPQRTLIEATLAQDPELAEEVIQLLQEDAEVSGSADNYFYSNTEQPARHAILSSFAGEVGLKIV
ncbi:hypothetical protein [Bythopirellula polymerisocia]|uniref:Uncharacterized protein n=1 Tax=Bythopirellula polymerisocia TaxID=2528003 RepID=A0A5C6CQM6_9BACT|nr:hypothetical protein [Bythopirellula polymerisocia]TWU25751.1 hypothetical protein Pla144_29630 [Bythopirellula polymerisocia]